MANIINNCLCFVSTARDTLTKDDIIDIGFAFFDEDTIKEAKEILYNIHTLKQHVLNNRRQGPNKKHSNFIDIYNMFEVAEEKKCELPIFLANGWNTMPCVRSSMDPLTNNITSLCETVLTLQKDIACLRESNIKLSEQMNINVDVREELADIKKLLLTNNSAKNMKIIKAVPSTITEEQENGSLPLPEVKKNNKKNNKNKNNSYEKIKNKNNSYANAVAKEMDQVVIMPENQQTPTKLDEVSSKTTTIENTKKHEWQLVQNKRYTQNKKVTKNINVIKQVKGNRKFEEKVDFAPEERNYDLYIGGCNINTIPIQLINFCMTHHKINVIKCEDMQLPHISKKFFKMCVNVKDRDTLLDPYMWPHGVIVRKFTTKKVNKVSGN